jgi:hypothetical protein
MAISISAVVLLAIVLLVLIRSGRLGAWSAVAAVLFGFFLASTGAAPAIHSALSSAAQTLGRINF